jgi:hypothetical protein
MSMSQSEKVKLEYWRNGVMMGLVRKMDAQAMMMIARESGMSVHYVEGQQHFSIDQVAVAKNRAYGRSGVAIADAGYSD